MGIAQDQGTQAPFTRTNHLQKQNSQKTRAFTIKAIPASLAIKI